MTAAKEIVRTEFERSYKYNTNLRDIWAGDGTECMVRILHFYFNTVTHNSYRRIQVKRHQHLLH